jgi:transcriptional regulator with XRE-family HTH domain
MSIADTRKSNLRLVIARHSKKGTTAKFARDIEYDPSQLSQILTGQRNMGETLAREIEKRAKLPKGYLDNEHPDDTIALANELAAAHGEEAQAVLQRYISADPVLKNAVLRLLEVPQKNETEQPHKK